MDSADREKYAGPKETGDVEAAASEDVLHRKLKSRHMQMIAIGGSIGTGLLQTLILSLLKSP